MTPVFPVPRIFSSLKLMPGDQTINTLVIGLGSYYGHDVSGLEVIPVLKNRFLEHPQLYFYTTNNPQDILVLTEKLKQQSLKQLIILDALPENMPVCEITQYSHEQLQNISSAVSDHSVSLYEVLEMVKLLYFPELKITILGLPDRPVPQILQQSIALLKQLTHSA